MERMPASTKIRAFESRKSSYHAMERQAAVKGGNWSAAITGTGIFCIIYGCSRIFLTNATGRLTGRSREGKLGYDASVSNPIARKELCMPSLKAMTPKIVDRLNAHGRLDVDGLSDALGVSTVTIAPIFSTEKNQCCGASRGAIPFVKPL